MSKNTEAIFILLFSIFIFTANGQVVKFIKNPLTAKYRVFIWYIVDNPMVFKNAMTLFEVKRKEEADLIVFYTNKKSEAGYKPKN